MLLKDLYRVCWVDDRIFVFDRSDEINALFVFSDQGNFITRVGLRGQGPEEYLYLTHFFVDEKERILTLVDFGGTDSSIYYHLAHEAVDPWKKEEKPKKSKQQLINRLDDYDRWLRH